MILRYILNKDGNPVPADENDWYRWYATPAAALDRQIAMDEIDNYFLSTVFLGVDAGRDSGPPVLWETVTFVDNGGGKFKTLSQRRYRSRQEALDGHAEAVAAVLALIEAGKRKR